MLPAQKPPADENGNPTERPEWLPEAYWNEEEGIAEIQKLAGSLAETQTALRNRQKEMREELLKEIEGEKPEGPEAYKVDPEQIEATEFKLDENDPMVAAARQWAFDAGLKPEHFSKLVNIYAKTLNEGMPDPQKEIEKLGENAPTRIDKLAKQAGQVLSEEEWNAFLLMTQTAQQVEILEKLMAKSGGPQSFDGDPEYSAGAQEELDRLLASDEYWKRDVATVNKVQRLQERLSKQRRRV